MFHHTFTWIYIQTHVPWLWNLYISIYIFVYVYVSKLDTRKILYISIKGVDTAQNAIFGNAQFRRETVYKFNSNNNLINNNKQKYQQRTTGLRGNGCKSNSFFSSKNSETTNKTSKASEFTRECVRIPLVAAERK